MYSRILNHVEGVMENIFSDFILPRLEFRKESWLKKDGEAYERK